MNTTYSLSLEGAQEICQVKKVIHVFLLTLIWIGGPLFRARARARARDSSTSTISDRSPTWSTLFRNCPEISSVFLVSARTAL